MSNLHVAGLWMVAYGQHVVQIPHDPRLKWLGRWFHADRPKRRDSATWTGWKIQVEPSSSRVEIEIGDQRFMVEFVVPHFKNHHLTCLCFKCFFHVHLCYAVFSFLVVAAYFQRDMNMSGQKDTQKAQKHQQTWRNSKYWVVVLNIFLILFTGNNDSNWLLSFRRVVKPPTR